MIFFLFNNIPRLGYISHLQVQLPGNKWSVSQSDLFGTYFR